MAASGAISTTRRPSSLAARLARRGINGEGAAILAGLAIFDLEALDVPPPPALWSLVEALTDGADPERALTAFERLNERSPSSWAALHHHAFHPAAGAPLEPLRRLARLAGASDTLPALVVTDPGLLAVLTGDLAAHDATAIRRMVAPPRSDAAPARNLARTQRRGLARIALRDLLGLADTPTVARELSNLADGVLSAALDRARLETGIDVALTIVGMGKLGGQELNYVSDVDVLFVCDGDAAAATRLASAFLRLCGAMTPEGRAYEVDVNLRPEGRDGALVRSLDSYRAYYERWAASWEFQALLKARPVAGDEELGRAFVELVAPLVWPARREATAIDDIQRLKGVVEGSRKVLRAGERQVKLAPGGLRDIEFAVQLLQLVHGRHDANLRAAGTLPALAALADGGYVGEDDAAQFADAYVFLRTIEHRLQLRGLRRTHELPADAAARQRLARNLGLRDGPDATALERFDAELRAVRARVRRLHEKLFYRPLLGRFAEMEAHELVSADREGRLDQEVIRDRLVALGFGEPDTALRHLDALAGGTGRRALLLRQLLPAMLPALAQAPDPDAGLARLRSVVERLERSPTLLATLRDRPPVAERLASLIGASPRVSRWLERAPEVLPLLADEESLAVRRDTEAFRRLATGLVRRGDDEQRISAALRRLVRREQARTAIRDLAGAAGWSDVTVELSALAEACLEVAVATVTPPDVALAVIGLGRLGGRELTYGSDLDVVLVFEPGEAREEALRATFRLLRLLGGSTGEGRAYEIDTRLRPEGADGPMARTLDSYRSYYERWAQPWEIQALTQARPVAGDHALGRAFVDVLAGIVYPPEPPDGRLEAIRAMKRRVEAERRRRGSGIDLKLDRGGLMDIEWTVQFLQLEYGGRLPWLRRRGTAAALDACGTDGVLAQADVAVLRAGHALLSRLRQALFLAGLRSTTLLPDDDGDLERVAWLLDYEADGSGLRRHVQDTMAAVRQIHERVFAAG